MLELVRLRCVYTLARTKGAGSECFGVQVFELSTEKGRAVRFSVSYLAGTIVAEVENIEVPAEVVEHSDNPHRRFAESSADIALREAVSAPLADVKGTMRLLLNSIKYHLRHGDLGEGLISVKSEEWSRNGIDYHPVPLLISVTTQNHSSWPLTAETCGELTSDIRSGVRPLLAMRHLHRAKNERSAHHAWIDATIAAELAVKEVLSRAQPELSLLLHEMPSPPIRKLYGVILATYLGEESPFKNALDNGQTRRNDLVHRPQSKPVSSQEAIDYVLVVERAIYHLLRLLYPSSPAIVRLSRLVEH